MSKSVVLVVGLGEVGRPLFELLRESGKFNVYGFDVDDSKVREIGQGELPSEVDIMHVCYPCTDEKEFMQVTVDYGKRIKPDLMIINSTVPPETTMKVFQAMGHGLVAHSPVRGVHKSREHMKWELQRWSKYVGGVTAESAESARKHFEELGLKVKVLKSSKETELAKLFETTYRAWMIACFQEMHRISRRFGVDFDQVVDFLEDIHRVRLDRPIHFPGVIRGHCVIPNAELLLKSYDSEFVRLILSSNEKRKEEIKNREISQEVDKIRERVKSLWKELLKAEFASVSC